MRPISAPPRPCWKRCASASRGPETMKPEAYERTLKARAFDVARYLLPLATNTSLGQIVNARTLETQVSRLLSHPAAEVRDLGAKLREAATGAGVERERAGRARPSWRSWRRSKPMPDRAGRGSRANLLTREVRTAPTLVKYAEPNQYLIQTRAELDAGGRGTSGRLCPSRACAAGRPGGAHRDARSRTGGHAALLGQPSSLSADSRPGRRASSARRFRRSSSWVCGTAASTTKRCAPSTPAPRCASTFSWTSAASATCTAIAAARRSSRDSRRSTATRRPPVGDLGAEVDMLAEAGVLDDYQAAHRSRARSQRADRRRPGARGRAVGAVPAAAGHARPLPVQNGLCRSAIHRGAALRARPATSAIAAWRGRCFWRSQRQHPTLARHIRVTDFTQPIDLLQR